MKDRVGRLRRRKLGPPLTAIFGFTRWPEDLTPDIYIELTGGTSLWYSSFIYSLINEIFERFMHMILSYKSLVVVLLFF